MKAELTRSAAGGVLDRLAKLPDEAEPEEPEG